MGPASLRVQIASVLAALMMLGCGSNTKTYHVPSEAMSPTLKPGDKIEADLDAYRSEDPKVGDIVVFHPPAPANGAPGGKGPSGQCGTDAGGDTPCPQADTRRAHVTFVKRIVAGPGDTIAIRDGHVVRNGKRQDEPYIAACEPGADCNFPKPIMVPKDHWYMLGDNRGASDDSRYWGPVPTGWIIGKVKS